MPENAEIVRAIYADWARGDFSAAEWAHPDIELISPDGPTPGRTSGVAAMAQTWKEVLNAWEDFRVLLEDCRQLDDGRVLVLIQNTGRGKASGMELGRMATRGANVWTIADGKATQLVLYWDRDRAFADLGTAG